MSTRRIPLVASAMALGAGAVWSLGAVTARLADRSDAFQYLIWRSIGIIVVIEILGRIQGKFPRSFCGSELLHMAEQGLTNALPLEIRPHGKLTKGEDFRIAIPRTGTGRL